MSNYERQAAVLKAMSHPVRLQILDLLRAGGLYASMWDRQREATEAEEGLSNDLQPAAPSPGTVVPEAGNMAGDNMVTSNQGGITNSAATPSGGNSQ